LLGGSLAIIPSVAKEAITEIRLRCDLRFDGFTDRRK